MSIDLDDPRLTAYALGELDDAAEIAALETLLAAHPEAQQMVDEVRATGDLLRRELAIEHEHEHGSAPVRDLTIHRAVDAALRPHSRRWRSWGMLGLAASTLILGGTTFLFRMSPHRGMQTAERDSLAATNVTVRTEPEILAQAGSTATTTRERRAAEPESRYQLARVESKRFDRLDAEQAPPSEESGQSQSDQSQSGQQGDQGQSLGLATTLDEAAAAAGREHPALREKMVGQRLAVAPAPAPIPLPASAAAPAGLAPPPTASFAAGNATPYYQRGRAPTDATKAPGPQLAEAPPAAPPATISADTYGANPTPAKTETGLAMVPANTPVALATAPAPAGPRGYSAAPAAPPAEAKPAAVVAAADAQPSPADPASLVAEKELADAAQPDGRGGFRFQPQTPARVQRFGRSIGMVRENFAPLIENPFIRVLEQPQSTFALDVDTASYAIVRRYLMSQNAMPPKDAVRVEEMVNAFRYEDPAPTGEDPVAVHVEIARSPWSAENRLARIALTGRTIAPKDRPRANLVFLIDVSGSMDEPDKLPLLKRGMTMLTEQLGEGDRVAIVAYSNTARVVLPPTRGDQRREILSALESLTPGGSTNGAGGLAMAYDQAGAAFVEGGANRVILASDGDFNVGETDNNALVNLIQEKAKSRIFLTVLGFGRGNLQDARLEAMADKGNGHYHYIDSPREARRVLVQQVSGTLVTVAKDVKLQVDFNPVKVGAYRLIGYENRLLPAAAFRDDTKDGGELGAGHAVSALYELVPAGKEDALPAADTPQFVKPARPADPDAPESFVVKLAFKPPDGDVSTTREVPAVDGGRDYAEASESFRWAAAVASFGQILRESSFRGTATIDGVLEQAESARGNDPRGDREAFLEMVKKAKALGAR